MTLEQLRASMKLHTVKCWQGYDYAPNTNDAEHTYRVAALYDYLHGELFDFSAVLTHDNDEVETGDVPSPAKKHLKGFEHAKRLCVPFTSQNNKRLAKLCDKLERVLDLRAMPALTLRLEKVLKLETKRSLQIAKDLNKTKEVKKLLKELV